jgi:uncharacterized membrane protein
MSGEADKPSGATSGQAKAGLGDRLADLARSSKTRIGNTGRTLGRSLSARLAHGGARETERDAAPLRARVRAGLDELEREADAQAGEGLVPAGQPSPRIVSGRDLPKAEPPAQAAMLPRAAAAGDVLTRLAKTAGVAANRAGSGLSEGGKAATVLVERTRTLGRVGLTVVKARIAAVKRVEARRGEAKSNANASTGSAKITPIEADLPKRAPADERTGRVRRALWRDRRGSAAAEVAAPPAGLRSVEVPTERTTRTQKVRRQAGRRRLALGFGTLLTALVTGGIIHIALTFAIPALRWGSAYDRLRGMLQINTMRLVGTEQQPSPLPFLSPDMRYAMCRYDIGSGPVTVAATLPDVGWSLTLYTPQGDNFYAVPGQEGRVIDAAFTILPASDRLINLAPGVRKTDVDVTQVTSPQREGLVVIRAPQKGAAFQAAMLATLAKATCQAAGRR